MQNENQCRLIGKGGRIGEKYTDPSGKSKECGKPMLLDEDGFFTDDEAKGSWRLPQQCIGMCHWDAEKGKCFTDCSFRKTKEQCTGGCKWNPNGGFLGMGGDPKQPAAVLEFGGLPFPVMCTGIASDALWDQESAKAHSEAVMARWRGGLGVVRA